MDELIPALNRKKPIKTYTKTDKLSEQPNTTVEILPSQTREPLTTKNAVKFLLEQKLSSKVCRYCLNIAHPLTELDQILQVANKGAFYKVLIKDMIASFHPFKVADDPSFPNKICEKCLDRAISSYLFTQQCEQAERALSNCFEDMYDNLNKLDPLERTKKRGRHKLKPNYNILHAEHKNVIDYADPIIHIVNTASEPMTEQGQINALECLKCCEVLPNFESLLNHTKTHPKSMWYNCRLCGTSFPKHQHLRRHLRRDHQPTPPLNTLPKFPKYDCKDCGIVSETYYEHLQHLEKHKFKTVMKHLLDKKMDKLCSVCLSKERDMVPLESLVCLHGGSPELTGDRSVHTILASTLPEMNIIDNYTGKKICEKCLGHAITSYVFINHIYLVRDRLSTCISGMLENLDKITENNKNICIEIAESAIMKVTQTFEEGLLDNNEVDETKLNVEVLEDEFRVEDEDDSETEVNPKHLDIPQNKDHITHSVLNGYKLKFTICDDFMAFKKGPKAKQAKFICPVCTKQFVSDYFLKRHILKHAPRKAVCNICNMEFKSKFDMYEHKKMTHIFSRSVYLSCKICGRCYINEEKLKHHVKRHKNRVCQLCDKRIKSQSCYNDHMQRHMNKLGVVMKKYTQHCSFCEKDCPNDNELSLHVNKVHLQIKPYSCDMCERHFYTEYNLKSHKKVHNTRRREQCHFCNKVLKSRKLLVIHIRKHIRDMPFACQICNESFYSEFRLRKHMELSHGGRFCCKMCKTVYVTKNKLKEHVSRVHNSIF